MRDFWTTCGRHWGGKLGIFDPPIPVTACTGDASACLYGSAKIPSASATTTDLKKLTSAITDQITTTQALPSPTVSAGPSNTGNEGFASLVASAKSSLASSSSTLNSPESTSKGGTATLLSPAQSSLAAAVEASSEPGIDTSLGSKYFSGPQYASAPITLDIRPQSTSPSPPSPTIVAIVGSNTFLAVPGSPGIILPNESTASVGAVVTIPDATNSPVIVSVGSSNIFVGSESYIIPTISPAISYLQGLSAAVVDGQTISLGGPIATLAGGNVVSLGSNGVFVQGPAGTVTTISVYSAQTDLANMGVVNGQTISVVAGSSSSGVSIAIVAGQTISPGGPAATLSGGQVASLGSSGVVIQASDGFLTTIPVPSPEALVDPTNVVNFGIVGGQTISLEGIKGGTVVIVAGQTLSYGGSIATLPSGNVVSLGVNGVVIQAPSGKVTTIPVSKTAYMSASDKATKTVEFDASITSSPTLDAVSASGPGSPIMVQLDNSGQRFEALRWLSWFLVGWVTILIWV
ncbi:hypothetical protein NHQ30_003004 [Ciborinia camelliae]|nr:hypothetical protein NHQ30_003004 [Ciborinia camelliae]